MSTLPGTREGPASGNATSRLLSVRDLHVSFDTRDGTTRIVRGLDLEIAAGRTVALVGESGCGKSVTALSILRLLPSPPARIESGSILLRNSPDVNPRGLDPHGANPCEQNPSIHQETTVDLLRLSEREMCRVRGGRIAMIFQEPLTSLNPVMTIGRQIIEAIELHQPLRGRDARDKAVEALGKVGIPEPERRVHEYAHQLSGGMRQRVMIAMALSCEPELLIADEPTTALDVTVQAQILDLLRSIQQETGLSLLLITHDLGVVAQIAHDVYVMYSGCIVEHAPVDRIFSDPQHPYTQALMRCTPRLDKKLSQLEVIPGAVPDPSDPPKGCRFHPRCALARECGQGDQADSITVADGSRVPKRCVEGTPMGHEPSLQTLDAGSEVACWEAQN